MAMNIEDVIRNPKYSRYLDHGFVGLIDHMGSDASIEFATRMSYGLGTRTISDTRSLIRYLVRHMHTSPIEMGEVVFHLKLPIAIMRQLVRHRTASMNEYSARYSELTDEVYEPPADRIAFQSKTNKQGSGEEMSVEMVDKIMGIISESYADSDEQYRELLSLGLSRETARIVKPVGGYTEVVWKSDLKNFLHMIRLRAAPDAQDEIRQCAELMYARVRPLFPLVCQAFEDYWRDGAMISVFELEALRAILHVYGVEEYELRDAILDVSETREQALSKREVTEFIDRFPLHVPLDIDCAAAAAARISHIESELDGMTFALTTEARALAERWGINTILI